MCAIENECDQAIVQLLLDKGADCFHKGASGETAYSLAESRHTLSLIELSKSASRIFSRCDASPAGGSISLATIPCYP
jgi:ankyrin repeat protein